MNQCKFKVGDKIKKTNGTTFSNGKYIATVDSIEYNRALGGRIDIYLKETGFYLPQEELYLAPPFTKSDLKDGMVVTYRESYDSNNLKRVVFKGSLYSVSEGGMSMLHRVYLKYFSDTLEYGNDPDMDIMKVEYMGEVLWEREEESAEQKRIKELEDGIAKASLIIKGQQGGTQELQEFLNNLM